MPSVVKRDRYHLTVILRWQSPMTWKSLDSKKIKETNRQTHYYKIIPKHLAVNHTASHSASVHGRQRATLVTRGRHIAWRGRHASRPRHMLGTLVTEAAGTMDNDNDLLFLCFWRRYPELKRIRWKNQQGFLLQRIMESTMTLMYLQFQVFTTFRLNKIVFFLILADLLHLFI